VGERKTRGAADAAPPASAPSANGEGRRRVSLWFTDGARYGCVDARIDRGLGLEIRRREMGAGVRDAWGEDEHEATLCLSPAAVAELALALLAERYNGRADALEAIEALCEAADISPVHKVWS
jgi:hypothetical protein